MPKLQIPPNAKYQPQNPRFVGSDTGSTDPDDIRARLFCGCLNLETCQRNDIIELFSMYGPLKGVTHFPKGGYAFIQFESEEDAEDAVLNLNRYMFQGIRLDVKVAQKDKSGVNMVNGSNRSGAWASTRGRGGGPGRNPMRKRGPNDPAPSAWGKNARFGGNGNAEDFGNNPENVDDTNEDNDEGYEDDQNVNQSGYVDPYAVDQSNTTTQFGKAAQRPKPTTDEEPDAENDESNDANNSIAEETDPVKLAALEKRRDHAAEINRKRNEMIKQRIFENVEDEEGSVLDQNEIPDIMICGGCHLITSSIEFFTLHRQRECDRKIIKKHEDEPKTFSCFHCSENLRSSWELLSHLGRKHKICLYKENEEPRTIEYPPLYATDP